MKATSHSPRDLAGANARLNLANRFNGFPNKAAIVSYSRKSETVETVCGFESGAYSRLKPGVNEKLRLVIE